MIAGQKVVVVMPAFNAAGTLERTWREVIAPAVVDLVIIVDGASADETARLARTLPEAVVHVHARNMGYGANQKTRYRLALDALDASSISFTRSVKYGLGCLATGALFRLCRWRLASAPRFARGPSRSS